MLDRSKFIKKIHTFTPQLFKDKRAEKELAQATWNRIIKDPELLRQIYATHTEWNLPSFSGDLTQIFSIPIPPQTYQIASIDGSQIYPDRHQGTACYLINLGIIKLNYGIKTSTCSLTSEPSIFVGIDRDGCDITPEMVDAQRTQEELHFIAKLDVSNVLFDGSLIFWHLTSEELQKKYLNSYLQALQRWHSADLQCAGYISLPKSKEIMHMVRTALTLTNHTVELHELVDADIMSSFLLPHTRTTIFGNRSPIVEKYSSHLQPHFFYIHTGFEIARVELPAYIARSPEKVDALCAIIMDQVAKGFGYPLCITEAHEQAIIKGEDRDFFYLLLQQKTYDAGFLYQYSQKILKKRSPAI